MWALIAAIFSTIAGFSAGASGLGNFFGPSQPVETYKLASCYAPEPNVKITLKWPDNFTNLTDNRVTLNPAVFGDKPPTFDSEAGCYPMLLKDTNGNQLASRNYIRVRQNVRISSCKTDELAGPFTTDKAKCASPSVNAALTHRGICTLDGYPDLRKVAEVKQNSDVFEIFWNPFSHNVGCNYDPNKPNCSIGDRSNINLREFIYVLKKRDAFPPDNSATDPSKCKVLWDAGSTNKNACSHYLDVYMAEDLYKKLSGTQPVPTSDPDYGAYDFYKKAIDNCKEQSLFTPVVDIPTLSFPPTFIDTPFRIADFSFALGKIVPETPFEMANYLYYYYAIAPSFFPPKTNLIQIAKSMNTLSVCPPTDASITPTPLPTNTPGCYAPLGTVTFQKDTNVYTIFTVFSNLDTPQTFYFQQKDDPNETVYQYTPTEENLPSNLKHAPALQLTALEFTAENMWTWATPQCKPAIYLYPEKPTQVHVKLNIKGELTKSNPLYHTESGWNVTAYPDGKILQANTTYPYLFYEAEIKGVSLPKEGYIWSSSELPLQLQSLLHTIGFSQKETADFLDYWLPRLKEKPYYFVSLIPENQINREEKLQLSPAPDTLIRARVVFEGLDAPISIPPPQAVPSHKREGFVVADWGGSIVGKSCTDITVK